MASVASTVNQEAVATPGGAASFIDPATLMRIKSLQVRAKVVVEGFYSGLHRSPFHGFSVEFSEYRQYCPGDDLRYFDWRLYARTDRDYIKRFEDETNSRCYLLVDMSRSMGYGSLSYTKAQYATTMAATLAYFLTRQRDAVGLTTFDERILDYIPARYRIGQLHRLIGCLERTLSGSGTNVARPLEQVAEAVHKRGLVVLISDLLAPLDDLESSLSFLRARGHEVVVFRVLDPAEREFQFEAPARFHDLETGRDVYIDPRDARRRYLERFAAHEEAMEESCARLGIDFYRFATDRPLELSLFDYLKARLHRGKRVLRRGRG